MVYAVAVWLFCLYVFANMCQCDALHKKPLRQWHFTPWFKYCLFINTKCWTLILQHSDDGAFINMHTLNGSKKYYIHFKIYLQFSKYMNTQLGKLYMWVFYIKCMGFFRFCALISHENLYRDKLKMYWPKLHWHLSKMLRILCCHPCNLLNVVYRHTQKTQKMEIIV